MIHRAILLALLLGATPAGAASLSAATIRFTAPFDLLPELVFEELPVHSVSSVSSVSPDFLPPEAACFWEAAPAPR